MSCFFFLLLALSYISTNSVFVVSWDYCMNLQSQSDVFMNIAWIHSQIESCSSSPLQQPLKSENETAKRAKTKRRAADAQHSVEG